MAGVFRSVFSFLFWRCLPCGFYMLLSFLSQIHPTASENSCQQQRCLLAQDLGPVPWRRALQPRPAARGEQDPHPLPTPAAPLPSQACSLAPACPRRRTRRGSASQTLDSRRRAAAHVLPRSSRDGAVTLSGSPSSPPPVTEVPPRGERGQTLPG